MKTRLLTFLRHFPEGKWYPPLCLAIVLLCHALSAEAFGFSLLFLLAAWGFWVGDSLRPFMPHMTGAILMISRLHTPSIPSHSDYFTTLPFIIPVALSILVFLFSFARFAYRHRKAERRLASPLWIGILAWVATVLLAGIFSSPVYGKDLLFALGVASSIGVIYLLFSLYGHRTREEAEHFLYCLMLSGIVVVLELLLAYATTVQFNGLVPVKESVMLGWGFWTQIGAYLALALPASLYFARSHKRGGLYLATGALLFLGIILATARGGMLFGGLILLACLLLLVTGGKNKGQNRIVCAVVLGLGLIGVLLLSGKIFAFLSEFLRFGLGDNGRFELYRLALQSFLRAPLFGVGYYDSGIVSPWVQTNPHLYHNTLLQMLASGGALGALAYLFHRAQTVRLFWQKRRSPLSLFLLLIAAAVVLTSLVDEHIFHIYPAILYTAALYYAEGDYAN